MAAMVEEDMGGLNDEQLKELQSYRASLPCQLEVEAVSRLLADERLSGARCLDVSGGSGMVSHLLRKLGGDWLSVTDTARGRERVALMTGGDVALLGEDGRLPFEDKAFDVVVVSSCFLARRADDESLVAACHRVMRDGGVLVACAQRKKSMGMIPRLRKIMGVTATERGLIRDGYTEKQMFELLRSGFDVLDMCQYQRFFVELTRALGERRELYSAGRKPGVWSYRVAYQFDMLLFLTRGYMLALRARRRTWRSRVLPDLAVGGAVSGAVLERPSV